jgi:glycosyltransferase involved in cell wall biosynthesis
MLLVIILFLILLYLLYKKINKCEKFNNTKKVTIIILNYNRPHNIEKLVPILANYNNVGEIIVSHGKKETQVLINHPKVINEISIRNTYYAMNRFFLADMAKNDLILYLDDDILLSENDLQLLIDNANKNGYNNLYGPTERSCSKDGYDYKVIDDNKRIILTNIALIGKETSIKVLDKMKENSDIFNKIIDNKGNGEDIFFSKIVGKYFGKNIFVPFKYTELDNTNGYSAKDDHYIKRSMLCKLIGIN